jgi:uncharacterized protein
MTVSRLRHASPWVIDTRALSRQPGTMREFELTAPATGHAETPVLQIPDGADIALFLRLEAVAEGVMVSGRAAATAVGQCARCLTDIEVDLDVAVRELYAYPGSTTAATTDDDEIPRIVDDLIDLEHLVHDELVLAMPLAPLCSPECRGLCLECGARLDEVGPEHHHETLDPRWAALAAVAAASRGDDDSGAAGAPVTTGGPVATTGTTSTEASTEEN